MENVLYAKPNSQAEQISDSVASGVEYLSL